MRSVVNTVTSFASLIGVSYDGTRQLQPTLPDYTSPPTDFALAATPQVYRENAVIDAGRAADANGTCFDNITVCQIPFVPAHVESPRLGVVFYNGALVDPRSYSPIAKELSKRYGIAVALQIFNRDLALPFGSCETGRVELAQQLFPSVEKWVLAGHSYGGIAAMADVWASQNDSDSKIGGLSLLGSYIRQDFGCGAIDFTDTQLPMASVSGTLDLIVNSTLLQEGDAYLSTNDTFRMEILGGNHAQFGSYDASGRFAALGQVDGNATIDEQVQLDLSTSAIAHVASRMGIPFPEVKEDIVTSGGSLVLSFGALVMATSSLVFVLTTSF